MSELATVELSYEEASAITQAIRETTDAVYDLIKRAHDGKAWKALGHPNWEEYVRLEFQMSRRQSYRLLDYAAVREALCPNGHIPTEGQARPLAQLETPEQQREAWTKATEAAAAEGKPVTAKHVAAAAEEVKAEAIEADEIEPPKRERAPTYQPSNGLMYADNAISQLKKIQHNDTQRTRAFDRVLKWIEENK